MHVLSVCVCVCVCHKYVIHRSELGLPILESNYFLEFPKYREETYFISFM